MLKRGRTIPLIIGGIVLLLLLIMVIGSRFFTDLLWFAELGFSRAYLIRVFAQSILRIIIGLIIFFFFYFNLRYTRNELLYLINLSEDQRVSSIFQNKRPPLLDWLNAKRLNYIFVAASAIFALLFSAVGAANWETILKFIYQAPSGEVDPIFGNDISFYLFTLPVWEIIREIAVVIIIFALIIVGVIYLLGSGINSLKELKFKLSRKAKHHLSFLLILYLLTKIFDYRLQMYQLLYSQRGVTIGASFTDIHATLPGLRILMVVVALVIGVVIYSLYQKKYHFIIGSLGLWIIASLLLTVGYPQYVQRFRVEPNELARESQYISYNIDMTQKAYDLAEVEHVDYPLDLELTREDIDNNREIFDNVRLWDHRPLQATYSQMQELRQYYNFVDVDVDRYEIDGEYQQVFLSLREVDQTRLPSQAQTWVNQVLKYTHGYGAVMSSASDITGEGLPNYIFSDIPPKTESDLELNNPSVYFGEKTDQYVVVNNAEEEFHYPDGGDNVYTNYSGDGGIQLSNFLRRALFALRFQDIRLVLADDITPDSRMMYDRNIHERARKVAPFLEFDDDPYPVLADGQFHWVYDAYTLSNRYPYSQPYSEDLNYIRNSVKMVIDAYTGETTLYIVEEDDPVVQTYANIFPEMFAPMEEMPEEIRSNIRYPQNLFNIQAEIYSVYHMNNPQVFYNREDVWNVPNENYAGRSIQMEPYYIITKLPGEEEAEYILMLPFTPAERNNMVAWMAARSDGDNYGKLKLYDLPRTELAFGPSQIESRIDQNAYISQLLSLWDQKGSNVIRGNLLALPVENSMVYIEPIFLQAESGALPELRQVIVAYGNMVVMEDDLETALDVVFGEREPTREVDPEEVEADEFQELEEDLDYLDDEDADIEEPVTEEPVSDPETELPAEPLPEEVSREIPDDYSDIVERTVEVYEKAQSAIAEGDWQTYGTKMAELQELLSHLKELE